jgi:hypothetical protein
MKIERVGGLLLLIKQATTGYYQVSGIGLQSNTNYLAAPPDSQVEK